ncbi:LysR substrate-binding domain-containing protein [Streptomyces sp. NPDC005813]|uniref:LysR substrate-binding domain-containing protein n=1 Tax=Streptomyces sp. NPDC005813 TaxID=3155592 RepID=UPI0034118A1D
MPPSTATACRIPTPSPWGSVKGAASAGCPGLNLHLVASGGPVPFDRESIDVAIRRNDFEVPEGLSVFKLFDEHIGPVCTPGIARELRTPTDLARVQRLNTRTRLTAWDDWAACHQTTLPPAVEQTFEHFYLSLQAAASGLGVAIGPLALVRDDLETGRLVAPFGFEADGSAYLLITVLPPEDERVVALLAWLHEQARQMPHAQ